ncbi:MAG: preprotein translocase subunit YajC [Bacteroidales bacterium]|nr:preprotein translocase subunit YajC [Bacteroidales bacterium]
MTLSMILLQAQAPGTGSSMMMWLMLIMVFVVMWAFMIRPQRKQQKELEKFRNELKKGDKVVTVGGIYGTVAEISDRTVIIKVDGETKLRVDKNSLVKDFTATQQ